MVALLLGFLVIGYVLGDTVSGGRLHAATWGGAKGVTRQAARDVRSGTSTALGRSASGRAVRSVGRTVGTGYVTGYRDVRAKQAAKQDPARAMAGARFGRPLDLPPRRPANGPAKRPSDRLPARPSIRPSGPANPPANPPANGRAPANAKEAHDPAHPTDGCPWGVCPHPKDEHDPLGKCLRCNDCMTEALDRNNPGPGPDAGVTTSGGTMPAPGQAPTVRVESLEGGVLGLQQWAAMGAQLVEGLEALGLRGAALGQAPSAVDMARAAAATFAETHAPLMEAASAAPDGTDDLTIAQARAQ